MTTVIVTVPRNWLLTANQRTHWATKARITSHLRHLAATAYHDAGSPRYQRAAIVVHVTYPDRRRRDVHNTAPTVKALIDGMTAAGLLPDDDDAHLTGPDVRPTPADRTLTGFVRFRLTITEGIEE